jgi:hypothetical protein
MAQRCYAERSSVSVSCLIDSAGFGIITAFPDSVQMQLFWAQVTSFTRHTTENSICRTDLSAVFILCVQLLIILQFVAQVSYHPFLDPRADVVSCDCVAEDCISTCVVSCVPAGADGPYDRAALDGNVWNGTAHRVRLRAAAMCCVGTRLGRLNRCSLSMVLKRYT